MPFFFFLLYCSLHSTLSLAQGGPPMLTDDPDTPGDRHWENNIAVIVDSSSDGQILQTPNWDLNYGYGERIQLNYQAGIISQYQPRVPNDSKGLTQETIGVKWRFLDVPSETQGLSASIYPKYSFRGPLSSPDGDLTPRAPNWQLPAQVKIDFGKLNLAVEMGQNISDTTTWFYGSVIGYSITKETDLMAEIHADAGSLPAPDDWLIALGSRIKIAEALDFIVSLSHFIESPGSSPDNILYAGVTLHN